MELRFLNRIDALRLDNTTADQYLCGSLKEQSPPQIMPTVLRIEAKQPLIAIKVLR